MQSSRQFEFRPGFLIAAAILLLILPLQWCTAIVFAAGFHELCHLLALRLCGCQDPLIRFGASGAVISAAPLPSAKALFCSLAGPVGQLLLVFLARLFPRLALCAAVQSAYNLLPINGLDGGHALQYFLEFFFSPSTAESVCRVVTDIILLLICILAVYATFNLHLGLLPVLAAGSLLIKATNGKIPCKSRPLRVQ